MTIKETLTAEPGFQYVIDNCELMSAIGRRRMLQQQFITDSAVLQYEYDNLQQVAELLSNPEHTSAVTTIRHQFMQMHDIIGTINNLRNHTTLEEIELFEIKSFSFLCMATAKAASESGISHILNLPVMDEIFAMLDPDNTNIPNFYIYDSYHPQLAPLRKQLKAKQTLLDNREMTVDEKALLQKEINTLFEQQNTIQLQVISRLSDQIAPYAQLLQQAVDSMAYGDFIFAKATLAKEWQLCRPTIADNDEHTSQFHALWNPRLRHRNEEAGLRYQPIDITTTEGVCLITGANMAGKTVLLKTLGIAQLLAQFGFYIPASKASVALVDDVLLCIGDEQNEMNGLSSFASEIIKISNTIERSRNERLLILIDEPARTTNPTEGKAIVQAVATLLGQRHSTTLITTHYSQLGLDCRKLRVKGFTEELNNQSLTPQNINQFMDYSLIEDSSDEVPHEAIRIATILNCDSELLESAITFLEK